MPRFSTMKALGFSALLMLAATTARAEALQVALHPSEVVDASTSDSENVHALVTTELIRRGANLVPSDGVTKFLGGRPQGGCAALDDKARVDCLAELARSTGADRSILVNVAPYAGDRVVLTAQIVTARGTMLQELPPFSAPKKASRRLEDSIRPAVSEFVASLDLSMLDDTVAPLTSLEPSTSPDTQSAPLDAAVTTTAPSNGGLKRTAGYALTGAGALLLVGGVYGVADAFAKRGELEELYQTGPTLADDRQRVIDLREGARRSQTLGYVGTGLGAAAAAAGIWMLLTDTSADSTSEGTSWNWQLGPGYAGLSVALP